MAVKTGKIISFLEELAPLQLQATWDNSGLQVGDRRWVVDKILLALDVTLDVMQYAVQHKYGLILTHHPLLFHKLARVDAAEPAGQIIALAMAHHISIYAMHTNLDVVQGGVSDVLADLLGLTGVEVLEKQKGEYFKLGVFVPGTHIDLVRQAVGDAGAGRIGNYSHCSFSSPGIGAFLPREGAKPWLGEPGRMEEVEEYKLETLVPGYRLGAVLTAMKTAHPYEEVAYDLFPMAIDAEYGLGRIGLLPKSMSLRNFADTAAKSLGCTILKVCGDVDRQVKNVSVCGGSGGNLISRAHIRGADVLLTGDIDHHQALDALQLGLALVDPGHFFSEYPILDTLESYLRRELSHETVTRYPGSTNPVQIVTYNS